MAPQVRSIFSLLPSICKSEDLIYFLHITQLWCIIYMHDLACHKMINFTGRFCKTVFIHGIYKCASAKLIDRGATKFKTDKGTYQVGARFSWRRGDSQQ